MAWSRITEVIHFMPSITQSGQYCGLSRIPPRRCKINASGLDVLFHGWFFGGSFEGSMITVRHGAMALGLRRIDKKECP
jgi:hypothetical protein